MTADLDHLLERMAAWPSDAALDGLEPSVWHRVEVLRADRLVARLRLGAVGMALTAGLTAGGIGAVAAPKPVDEMAIFTLDAGLSPLAGLEASR